MDKQRTESSVGVTRWGAYALAVVATAATLAIRLGFREWFNDRPVLILFLIPIILSAYLGGFGPGLLSTIFSSLSIDYFLIPPIGTFSFSKPVDFGQWLLLVAAGTLISLLNERLHRLRWHAEFLANESKQAEERFKQLAESLPQLIWTTDAKGSCEYLSPQWLRYTGLSAESQLGYGWLDQIHPEDQLQTLEAWKAAVAVGKIFQVEFRIRRYDGQYRWFDTRAMPLRDKSGRVVKWFGSNTDIQEQKEIEQALREGENRFRTVVETGPDAIFIQTNGCFAYLNPTAVRLFGAQNANQLIGRHVVDSFHPEYREMVRQRIRRLNIDRQVVSPATEKILRCDGEPLDVEVSAVPFIYKGEIGALVFARDITSRRKAEEQLLLQGSALKAAANSIAITDRDGKIIWINPSFTRLTGYSEAEAIGETLRITKSDAHDESFYTQMWHTILTGNVWHGEVINKRKDGTIYTEEMTITPVFDTEHHITHFIAVKLDITDRKKADDDRKKLETQLLHAQKMEAIGRFAGGIAHDFNNILAAIAGNTWISLQKLSVEHPVRKYVNEIDKAVTRARDLVRRLLTFTRHEESVRKPVELSSVIEEAAKLLRAMLPAMMEIRTCYAAQIPTVNADATQIHQIIMNLGTNAMHAMGEKGGVLELDLDLITIDSHQAKLSPELYEGTFACLTVRDNGCGMDKATLERIFEPFFTTKDVGEGTGLGLSMVHGIMKNHKGAITVYSQPGQGTVFRLYFPTTEAALEPSTMMHQTLPIGQGEHILYVDDEKALVLVATRILDKIGYKVSGFTNPAEALQAFLNHPEAFDAVISDCSMPGMTGFNLVKQMKDLRPDFPAALASGYVREQDIEAAKKVGVQHFIAKPHTVEELATVLQELLQQKRSNNHKA